MNLRQPICIRCQISIASVRLTTQLKDRTLQGSSIFSCFTNLDGKGVLIDEASRLIDGEGLFLFPRVKVSPIALQTGIVFITGTRDRCRPGWP